MFILFQLMKIFFVVLFLDNNKPNLHKGGYDWCTVRVQSYKNNIIWWEMFEFISSWLSN